MPNPKCSFSQTMLRAHKHSLGCRSACAWDVLNSYSPSLLLEERKASSYIWERHIAVVFCDFDPSCCWFVSLECLQTLYCLTPVFLPAHGRSSSLQRELLALGLPCVDSQFLLFLWHLACHRLGNSRAHMAFPVFPGLLGCLRAGLVVFSSL